MGDPIRALELETVAKQIKKDNLLETVQITGKYLIENLNTLEAKHKGKIRVGQKEEEGEEGEEGSGGRGGRGKRRKRGKRMGGGGCHLVWTNCCLIECERLGYFCCF